MHLICPSKFCISIVFSISLWTAVIPRRNEKQKSCKILGANTVHYGECASGVCWQRPTSFPVLFSEKSHGDEVEPNPQWLTLLCHAFLFFNILICFEFQSLSSMKSAFCSAGRKISWYEISFNLCTCFTGCIWWTLQEITQAFIIGPDLRSTCSLQSHRLSGSIIHFKMLISLTYFNVCCVSSVAKIVPLVSTFSRNFKIFQPEEQ